MAEALFAAIEADDPEAFSQAMAENPDVNKVLLVFI